MQIPSEGGFNREGKFWIDIDPGDERAENRRLESFRVVETFQHCLRTLRETFALLDELLEHIESRFFFSKRPFDFDQTFFGAGQQLSILLQLRLGFVCPGRQSVGIFFPFLRSRACRGKFLFNFVTCAACF